MILPPVIVVFSNFFGVVRRENICYVFRVITPFSNVSGVVRTDNARETLRLGLLSPKKTIKESVCELPLTILFLASIIHSSKTFQYHHI